MKIPGTTAALLPKLVGFCARRRLLVVALACLIAAASVFASSRWLGVTTDTGTMFSASLPWKQRSAALARLFPQNDKLIVAVIDGTIPEEAEATASQLAAVLRQDHTHFTSVTQPDALPYLSKNAFLLISPADLQDILDRTTDAQPFLGELVADPSLRGLFSALGLMVLGVQHGQSLGGVGMALNKFQAALAAAASGHPRPLSWQELLGGKLADQAGKFRFVIVKPVLDYAALQPGGAATEVVRRAAARLPYVQQHDARVRLTGQVVLDDEEFATVAEGAVAGLIGSFLLVNLWLYLAVRSWRLMLPVMANLVFGLLLTTGFAAIVVGTLNLISVAFAVLFVGIAVDFAIQFTVRFRERRHNHPELFDALRETGRRSGSQILVASLATAAGFLAFSPTHFIGVAQLGVIAGFGMLIAFFSTITFLPALLCLLHPRAPAKAETRLQGLDPLVHRYRFAVVAVFGVLAAGGAALAPKIPFDGDPLHTKNQHSESVRTLHDLMQDPITDPYTVQAVLPSLSGAVAAGGKYAALKQTQLVLTLASFLPTDQDAKIAAVRDVASLLGPTLMPPAHPPAVTADSLRRSAEKLAAALATITPKLLPDDPLRGIETSVRALARGPDANLLAANEALIRFLPRQLDRLRAALDVHRITLADIPPELRDDWMTPDGQARVQALPSPDVKNGHAMRAWVKHALKVVPQSTGSAVYILKASDTITNAFEVAAYSAMGAITLILALALRRVPDVLLVLTPLTVSTLLTALVLRSSGMSLNFANIIALPLLLGVGVSFNIYFVMNWRAGVTRFLATGTARAVVFSALTTSTAFGSLALSQHPGTASMGALLLMCLGCTVATTLVFLPALLSMVPRPHVPLGGR